MFHHLTERQRQILSFVVRTYVEEGNPIGSKTLVERYHLDVSSATVRNELAALSEMGFLHQSHTSGGRIPTEIGYRYFVQQLVGEFELPIYEQQTIRHQFHQARLDLEQWMRLAAAILARASHGASFVTAPRPRFSRFRHLELISTQGRMVLLIVVFQGGIIKQEILTLASPVPQTRLSATAVAINVALEGFTLEELQARLNRFDELGRDVLEVVSLMMRRADSQTVRQIYRDGFSNIVNDEGTRQALRVLEERTLLNDVVNDVFVHDQTGVQVIIGGEGRWEELKHCTLILSRYGNEGDFAGEVAVVGPTRMPYGRNISAVRYVAEIMSSLVQEHFINNVPNSNNNEVS